MSQQESISVLQNQEYGFQVFQVKNMKNLILYTTGLSNNEQTVDEGWEAYNRIEVAIVLPEYWDLNTQPWPLTWIAKIAAVPQKNKTWFRPGDTLSAGKEDFCEQLKGIRNFLLLEIDNEVFTHPAQCRTLAVLPIFDQELKYKQARSGTALINYLKAKQVTEEIDIYRTSSVRKKVLGLF